MSIEAIQAAIRDVPNFPKEGIVFKDISPIIQSPELFREVIDIIGGRYSAAHIDSLVIIDARGFIFGSALAYKMGCGMSLIRKRGKLPWITESVAYELEYGTAEMEIHVDAVHSGDTVLIVDDLLATGGTARAAIDLVRKIGGKVVAAEFVIELKFLQGRRRLPDCEVNALISFD